MSKTTQYIVFVIFLIGLITTVYFIFKFLGWIGLGLAGLLAIFGLGGNQQESVEIPGKPTGKRRNSKRSHKQN